MSTRTLHVALIALSISAEDWHKTLERNERGEFVRTPECLAIRRRVAFWLRCYSGLSWIEIAVEMGLPAHSTAVSLCKAQFSEVLVQFRSCADQIERYVLANTPKGHTRVAENEVPE